MVTVQYLDAANHQMPPFSPRPIAPFSNLTCSSFTPEKSSLAASPRAGS